MTYPPQQPGPGGWGQQPPDGPQGPNPQQGQPQQQQPAWYGNQHTGMGPGQPSQPPPAQPAPHQPGPQQPGSPQQPPPPPDWGGVEFGQSSWILDSNAFGDAEPPKKTKSKLPWILGLVGVLVLAGGGAVALVFFLNSGPGDPQPVAEDVIQNVNSGQFDTIKSDLCQSRRTQLENELNQLREGTFDLRIGQVTTEGEKATAALEGTWTVSGTSQRVNQDMGLVVENGQWKVCQFDQ